MDLADRRGGEAIGGESGVVAVEFRGAEFRDFDAPEAG